MTAPTHITFAEFVYLLLLTTTGVSLSFLNAGVVAICSLLPDIDTAASTVGRVLPFISVRLERKFGHRTLTHSTICIAGLAILLLPLYVFNKELYTCAVVGYASHPFIDTMTVNGVKLFYPFSTVKCVFPFEVNNPHRYRVQTGSKMDKTLAVIFLIGCIPTFIIALQGYERFIRTTQHNIDAAVRDFNEFSRDHLVFADVKAYNMLTKQPLNGTFKIIGALNPHTLVFKGSDEQLHTLGKEFQADYAVEKILCSKGSVSHSSIQNIDLSNQLVSQVTSYIDTSVENYFFGVLATTDKVSLPENVKIFSSITGSGSAIKFNFATYEEIRRFNLEFIFVSKGIITIKTISSKPPMNSTVSNATLPKLENFTQLSVTLDAKESITFLKQKTDTIHEKELIAKKNLAQFFEDQISLNQEKIIALENQRTAIISDLDQKIINTGQAVRIDSVQYEHNVDLSRNHFISGEILQPSELKWRKEKALLAELVTSKSTFIEKTNIDIRKLRILNSQLHAKEKAAKLQSEIRSTVNGVLIDIRQVPHNNKMQFTFIIKRIN